MTGVQTDFPQVLAAEEQGAGLQQPSGIGQRPRPMSSEEGPQACVKNSKNSPQLPTNTAHDKYKVASKHLDSSVMYCGVSHCPTNLPGSAVKIHIKGQKEEISLPSSFNFWLHRYIFLKQQPLQYLCLFVSFL